MKKIFCITVIVLLSGIAYAGSGVHWGYSGHDGPEHWGDLSPEYSICASGKNQSPINLSGFIEADLKPIAFDYRTNGIKILNNGHTVQVNHAPGSTIAVEGHMFELKQFHFHSPSENHINGTSFPLEAHLVHSDTNGNLAVVAVMFETSDLNKVLAEVCSKMPEHAGDKHDLSPNISAERLLPSDRDYYRFNGSLTTPPCSEGVWWLVMKKPVSASKTQIERFRQAMQQPNNRPLQKINSRPVLQ